MAFLAASLSDRIVTVRQTEVNTLKRDDAKASGDNDAISHIKVTGVELEEQRGYVHAYMCLAYSLNV